MNSLVVGGSGFIGSYLLKEIKADNLDLVEGLDVKDGISKEYKTIIFLACNQEDSVAAYKDNIGMYLALDSYRKKYPETKLIYTSSAAVYTHNSHYAQSKILGEVYAKRFKFHSILRLSNVYGHGDGHGAPDKFLRGERTINGNGNQIRDLISVEQVVTSIKKYCGPFSNATYNISTGVGTTVNDMFKMFGTGKPEYVDKPIGVWQSILEPGIIND